MTQRHPPTNEDLTHLVVRLENALNSNPPRKINASFLFERSLTKSLALKKFSNAQPYSVPSLSTKGIMLWEFFFSSAFFFGDELYGLGILVGVMAFTGDVFNAAADLAFIMFVVD
jgi:hypothetical protein